MTTPKSILIVEDEIYLNDLYTEFLSDEGYEVYTAKNGLEGYDLIKSRKFDLVLLDIMMPGLTGIEVLQKLVSEDGLDLHNDQYKIILLTNLGKDDVIAEAISLGARGYLVKSDYTPDQILEEVKKYT